MATKKKKTAKKAVAKKPAAKKAAAKKPAKKAAKKPAPKKGAKKSAPKKSVAKKAAPKKFVVKPAAKKASVPKAAAAPAKPKLAGWDNFFTPLDDRLVVVVEGPAEKTAGGIYIPASVGDRPNQGRVVVAGRGKKDKKGRLRPMDVKVGETVLFGTYAGMKMVLNNQEVLMLREEDIMGVVE